MRANRLLGASWSITTHKTRGSRERQRRLLEVIASEQTRQMTVLGILAYEMKVVKEDDVLQFLVDSEGIGLVDLRNYDVHEELRKSVDVGACWATWSVPFDREEDFTFIATAYYLSPAVRTYWRNSSAQRSCGTAPPSRSSPISSKNSKRNAAPPRRPPPPIPHGPRKIQTQIVAKLEEWGRLTAEQRIEIIARPEISARSARQAAAGGLQSRAVPVAHRQGRALGLAPTSDALPVSASTFGASRWSFVRRTSCAVGQVGELLLVALPIRSN